MTVEALTTPHTYGAHAITSTTAQKFSPRARTRSGSFAAKYSSGGGGAGELRSVLSRTRRMIAPARRGVRSNCATGGTPTVSRRPKTRLEYQPWHKSKRVAREAQVFDDLARDEVLLDDPLGALRRDVPVPRALRVHDADRPRRADAQAVALRAEDRPVLTGEVQFLQPLLEVHPGLLTDVGCTAVRTRADEQVTPQLADTEPGGHHVGRQLLRVGHGAAIIRPPAAIIASRVTPEGPVRLIIRCRRPRPINPTPRRKRPGRRSSRGGRSFAARWRWGRCRCRWGRTRRRSSRSGSTRTTST